MIVTEAEGEESVTAVVLADPSVLDMVRDPGLVIVEMLEHTKVLLAEATRLEDVTEWKARAGALESYVRQRDLGKDAELAAAEIVRRAERRIGQLVQEEQEAGRLAAGSGGDRSKVPPGLLPRPRAVVFNGSGRQESETMALADDVDDEHFEKAIDAAKSEGNLSRSNIVRKLRPDPPTAAPKKRSADIMESRIRELADRAYTSQQIAADLEVGPAYLRERAKQLGVEIPADQIVGKRRALDHNRVVDATVASVEAAAFGLDIIDFEAIDVTRVPGWIDSLSNSLRSLNRLHKQLKETIRD